VAALLLAACGSAVPGVDGTAAGGASAAGGARGGTPDSQAALFPESKAGWKHVDRATRARIDELARDYVGFLARSKTPRRAVAALVDVFRAAGAAPLGDSLEAGQRAFWIAPGGDAALLVIGGRGGAAAGVRAVVAAVDGPRIDLKQVPLYQHDTAAMLDTALYGQLTLESWLVRPLALYLYLARPKPIELAIGEAPGDPVFDIPDVPIHLARTVQSKERPVADPERMDAYAGVSAAAVRAALRARGLGEADLVEAEAYLVPAGPPALIGVDRAMVAGYAQSQLALAYLATRALAAAAPDQATLAVILVSKSQVDNAGATGVGFVGRALSRALSALGGELDILASRRAHARSALLVAATAKGAPNAGLVLSPEADDALPVARRRALDRFERVRVPVQIGEGESDAAVNLGALDVDAVALSIPVKSRGAPLELCSTLDLHYALSGLASWFAP
jgi:aspartyl aminopeptidase